MTKGLSYQAQLKTLPPKAHAILQVVNYAGVGACIFGGAVRDADCSAFYGRAIPINDYDMRVWLPASSYKESIDSLLTELFDNGADIQRAPNSDLVPDFFDDAKPRYNVTLFGCKIDLSIRAKPDAIFEEENVSALVAKDRVEDSDIALSAVAVALAANGQLQAYALPQYITDRAQCRMTVFTSNHNERSIAYAERLKAKKFPGHTIVAPK